MNSNLTKLLLTTMRYSLLIFMVLIMGSGLLIARPGSGQDLRDTKISIAFHHEPLNVCISEISTRCHIGFAYNPVELQQFTAPVLSFKNKPVSEVLEKLLHKTGLVYKAGDDHIVIYRPENAAAGHSLQPVPIKVSGILTDTQGSPVAGATVRNKRTREGTVTDTKGAFALLVEKGDVLEFSYLGFMPKSITVGDKTYLEVTLEESTKTLQEMVVTALGIKKDIKVLGYSTTELPGSDFTKSREVNIGNALTGQVAGVNVAGASTGPYGSSRIVIRGNSSLTGNNQPLYVIDGIPYDNNNQGMAGQWGGQDFGDGLANLNPDDIQSIQVLKGVAASALYGYRGANGAILITTRSGTGEQGIGVEVNDNITLDRVIDERDYQYAYGQGVQGIKPTTAAAAAAAEYFSWGAKMDGSQAVNFLGKNYAYSPVKDNFEKFYKTGLNNTASVGLTGGNENGHFRLGLSNMNLTTVIPNSDMQRQAINLNSTYNVTKKLQLTITADYSFEKVKNRASFSDAPGNVIASLLYLANSFDVKWLKPTTNPDGSELLPGTDIYFNNPYFVAYKYQNTTSRNRLTGGLTLKYNLTDWLFLQGQVTRDGYIYDVTNITPSGTGYVPGGNFNQDEQNYHELNGNFMVGIEKQLGKRFGLHAHLGGNTMDNVRQDYGVTGGPFLIPYLYTANNIANRPFTIGYGHYRVNSLYGSADLGFNNYLFVTFTGRNDWYSTLNPKTNNYFYPSVSGSFVFSDAFRLPSWISFGKLRASYASSSNGTAPYQNILTYGLQGYTIGGQSLGYVVPTNIPNPNLSPVIINEAEAGFNMQFLDNRLGIDFALYNKRTTNDILPVTISPTSGYNGDVLNIGKIRNRGIELLLTATAVKARNFSWDLSFNYANNDNKVLYLGPNTSNIVIAGAFPRWGNGVSVSDVVGLPYAQIMGYAYKRDAKGNIVYSSGGAIPAGEPEHTDNVVPLGSGVYKVTGGFNNEFHYRNFSLSFLVDFKFGAKIYSGTNLLLYEYGLQKTTLLGRDGGYVGKGVMEDGKPNTINVPSQIYFQDLSTGADNIAEEFIYDASFIKLRAFTLGYSIPASILKRNFIKGLSISVVARNLATLMKHTPNIDPESNLNTGNGQGLELSGYPAVRSIGLNVNVKF